MEDLNFLKEELFCTGLESRIFAAYVNYGKLERWMPGFSDPTTEDSQLEEGATGFRFVLPFHRNMVAEVDTYYQGENLLWWARGYLGCWNTLDWNDAVRGRNRLGNTGCTSGAEPGLHRARSAFRASVRGTKRAVEDGRDDGCVDDHGSRRQQAVSDSGNQCRGPAKDNSDANH